tara:strand:+ start:140 stop:274 length:135 start_codon:yes stop_codon:yes gene_type:complete
MEEEKLEDYYNQMKKSAPSYNKSGKRGGGLGYSNKKSAATGQSR